MAAMFPLLIVKVPARYVLFETANPRHGHEWTVFPRPVRTRSRPQDSSFRGAVDTTTNFIEHPDLVAQRLERFTGIVGKGPRDRRSDCGFGTFAGFGAVDPEIPGRSSPTLKEGPGASH